MIYKGTVSKDCDSSGDCPFLNVGENKIEWEGNITKVEIIPHWRCL